MPDLEIRPPESADSPGNPHDALIDHGTGWVERLSEKPDGRGELAVLAVDVPTEPAGAFVFRLDRPLERELTLSARHQG